MYVADIPAPAAAVVIGLILISLGWRHLCLKRKKSKRYVEITNVTHKNVRARS